MEFCNGKLGVKFVFFLSNEGVKLEVAKRAHHMAMLFIIYIIVMISGITFVAFGFSSYVKLKAFPLVPF